MLRCIQPTYSLLHAACSPAVYACFLFRINRYIRGKSASSGLDSMASSSSSSSSSSKGKRCRSDYCCYCLTRWSSDPFNVNKPSSGKILRHKAATLQEMIPDIAGQRVCSHCLRAKKTMSESVYVKTCVTLYAVYMVYWLPMYGLYFISVKPLLILFALTKKGSLWCIKQWKHLTAKSNHKLALSGMLDEDSSSKPLIASSYVEESNSSSGRAALGALPRSFPSRRNQPRNVWSFYKRGDFNATNHANHAKASAANSKTAAGNAAAAHGTGGHAPASPAHATAHTLPPPLSRQPSKQHTYTRMRACAYSLSHPNNHSCFSLPCLLPSLIRQNPAIASTIAESALKHSGERAARTAPQQYGGPAN